MEFVKDYITVSLRIITVMPLFILVAIGLGKRHLAELSVFDFVVAVTMGSVAGADIADPEIHHGPTLYAIVAIGFLHVVFSRAILKYRNFGRLVTLDPTIVIQNGVVLKENLARVRYTVDELLYNLREKGIFELEEVDYALLEPSGNLSVLKKSMNKPLTPRDMGISTASTGIALPVILESKFHQKGLFALDLTEEQVLSAIKNLGYTSEKEVFIALANEKGECYVSPNTPPFPLKRIDH